jgi:peptidoglycan/xylan/chitin deacetylase (PgdA/CDA1 family)
MAQAFYPPQAACVFTNKRVYKFTMEKDLHTLDRRKAGRLLAGAAVSALTLKVSRGVKAEDPEGFSLPDNGLYVGPDLLEQIKAGLRPGLTTQKYAVFLPEIAGGDVIPEAIKQEFRKETKYIARKPDFTVESLSHLKKPLTLISTNAPLIGIGIDDGFDEGSIKEILRVTKKYGITYTDFMKGLQRKKFPNYIKEMINSELVEFGNHTETHRDQRNASVPGRRPKWEEFGEDLNAAEFYLNEFGQTSRPYLRPPGGAADEYTTEWNEQMGWLPITWNANIEDMPLNLQPGSIILAHYRPGTAAVYEKWVNAILARGLIPTAISNVVANASPDFWKQFQAP